MGLECFQGIQPKSRSSQDPRFWIGGGRYVVLYLHIVGSDEPAERFEFKNINRTSSFELIKHVVLLHD
jgi:hypothetical protein